MNAPYSLPESVQRKLAQYPAFRPVLILEGSTRSEAMMVALVLVAFGLPVVAMLMAQFSLAGLATVLASVLGIPGAVYWLTSRTPSDVIVANDGIHLFWRFSTSAKHRFIPFDTVREIAFPTGMNGGLCSRTFRLVGEKNVHLELVGQTRFGMHSIYRVRHNATSAAFEDATPHPGQSAAFRGVLMDLVPEKIRDK